MTKRTHTQWPLSVSAYGWIFILSGLMVFGVLGWYALHELFALNEESRIKTRALVNAELNQALEDLVRETESLARLFSGWDETAQQLGNATYYSYWRDNRVHAASFIPSYFRAIELYSAQGIVLSQNHDPSLPDAVPKEVPNLYLVKDHGGFAWCYIQSIVKNRSSQIEGYVGLKLDFLAALRTLERFRFVDMESLHVVLDEKHPIVPYRHILEYLVFEVVPNHEFQALQHLMIATLFRFALIGVAFALLFMMVLVSLFGMPSRRLSRQVDALRKGELGWLEANAKQMLPIAEFEKIRLSLYDYQAQLDKQGDALKENEAHLRAVLDNVVDGILTVDEKGLIESCNPTARGIFSVDGSDLRGRYFAALLSESGRQDYSLYFSRCMQQDAQPGQVVACELTAQRGNSEEFPLEIALTRMRDGKGRTFIIVARDITERKRAQQRLIYLANYDELTGLPNRTLYRDRLRQSIARAKRNEHLAAVVFMDLDQFKKVNDTLGHHVGDMLLVRAANRIKDCIREIDTLARFGGDEFVLILENIRYVDEIAAIVNKILQVFDKPFDLEGQEVFVGSSAGITIFPFDDIDPENLVKFADAAMFKAKELGGNTYQFFTAEINAEAVEKLSLENALRYALDRNEFRLHYQSRVDLVTGRVVGMEALLRWQHPQKGLVMPDQFIPLLEETGLIVPVGEWVLKTACAQTRHWNEMSGMNLRVSVNISARQFHQKNIVESFNEIIRDSGLDPWYLELEITESVLVHNVEVAKTILKGFNDMGIHLSIDDFGTGYSSMAYLKRLPISILKIDRSFLRDVSSEAEDAAIATAIVALARSLKLRVIAEGIENKDQLGFVQQLHCDQAQGFYFSRPLPVEQFENRVLRQFVHA